MAIVVNVTLISSDNKIIASYRTNNWPKMNGAAMQFQRSDNERWVQLYYGKDDRLIIEGVDDENCLGGGATRQGIQLSCASE